MTEKEKAILELIFIYSSTCVSVENKQWLIDQIFRLLTEDKYDEWIKEYEISAENEDFIYKWDTGIAP